MMPTLRLRLPVLEVIQRTRHPECSLDLSSYDNSMVRHPNWRSRDKQRWIAGQFNASPRQTLNHHQRSIRAGQVFVDGLQAEAERLFAASRCAEFMSYRSHESKSGKTSRQPMTLRQSESQQKYKDILKKQHFMLQAKRRLYRSIGKLRIKDEGTTKMKKPKKIPKRVRFDEPSIPCASVFRKPLPQGKLDPMSLIDKYFA